MDEFPPVPQIYERVKADGYCFIRNADTVRIAKAARDEYFRSFNRIALRSGGFNYRELQDGPIRKKNISSANGLGEAYAQVLQTTYYPKSHAFPAISAAFDQVIALRNALTADPADYGDQPETEGFWNARRIHHYPRGGGFMVEHVDTHFPNLLGDGKFIQLLYLLSQQAVDFNVGGGIVRDQAGELINLETEVGFGSLIVFDGRIRHGVRDVDPQEPFSFEAPNGRLAAIVNLYEYRQA